jgi:hypothetical protein
MSLEQDRQQREDAGRPTAETWAIPRRVWFILLSWGLAVLILAGLFSFWIYRVEREKDQAMCAMIQIIMSGPTPVAGPEGDRGRAIIASMERYRQTVHCQ